MSLEAILEKLPLYKRIETVLVVEADFVGFRAAVLHKKGQMLTVLQHASAESLEMHEAVKSLMAQLQQQGAKVQHAIMLTPAAFSTLVELKVPPKNKLSSEQMAETVRWELEPLLSQHQRVLGIGQILLSNGYLQAEQLEQVLAMQEADNHSKSREMVFKRIGEYAKELGFINTLQLERGLAKQAWFLGDIEQVQVDWKPQSQAQSADQVSYPWLVAGMSKPLLREWQAAFIQHGVKLTHCYPLTGPALMSVLAKQDGQTAKSPKSTKSKNASQEKPSVLFDLQEGFLSAFVFNRQHQMQTLTVSAHEPYLTKVSELYAMLGVDKTSDVYLADAASKTEQDAKLLQDDILQSLQVAVKTIDKPHAYVSANMRGAASHLMLNNPSRLLMAVPVADPLPPLMQRFEVRAILGAVLLVVLIGLAEASLLVRAFWTSSQLDEIAPAAKEIDDAIAKIKTEVELVKKYKEEVKVKTEEEKTLQSNLALLSNDLPARNKMLIDFLHAFEQTVSDEVVIDRLAEDTIFGFTINAWSISEQSAQEFVRQFQIAIHPMGFRLKNITVNQQTGRLGILGYAIHFNATSLDDQTWEKTKLNSNQGIMPTTSGRKK